jgi:lysozyme family protein
MANFDQAFGITMGHEGGYANDPTDVGGETYRGISRRYHPGWSGWKIIDGYKEVGFPRDQKAVASAFDDLAAPVQEFYKANFWNPLLLSEVSSQAIADKLFDIGVNMGTGRAGLFLQQSLNVLNKNGSLFADLVEDGQIGQKTLHALRIVLGIEGGEKAVLTFIGVCQGKHYMDYMKQSPNQEKFAWGWIRRVSL